MKKISIRERGLVGTFFCPEESSSAVIVLGGSSGGIPELRAEKLAEKGFASLALAYFGAEDLPPTLQQIPLEYFEKSIELLEKKGFYKIGLWGGSRGAEVSLILGTLFPSRIHAIAAHVPSSAVFGAFDERDSAAWVFEGLPVAPSAPFQYTQEALGESEKDAIKITPSFIKSMGEKERFEASLIPVEKLQCPLLLISAQDDQMWPSEVFAGQIVQRLKERNSSIFCSHISYPNVGHSPAKGRVGFHPIMKRWFSFGGNLEENAKAADEWIEKTVSFFREQL